MKITELIKKLSDIELEHGDVEVNIYKSFDQSTTYFNKIYFDDTIKNAVIAIYN